MKIGIIKERKVPVDHRVPFTPEQCKALKKQYPSIELVIEPSTIRCFKDEEYEAQGVTLQSDLSDCTVLMGVKEVPEENLIPNKTYFFFSHTAKQQPYNKGLLQTILKKNVQIVDYEYLSTEKGRVVAFGRFAGIVGAYNGLLTYGKKFNLYEIKPANECYDMAEMWSEFTKIKLPAIKILLTGAGRVSSGAIEVLQASGIREVTIEEYINNTFNEAVYAQADTHQYNKHIDGDEFNKKDFHTDPINYDGDFHQYIEHTDLLIAGAYWDPKAPVLFTEEDVMADNFPIKVIADITCDIQGSIPTTLRPSTIAEPVYDIVKGNVEEVPAYALEDTVSVMAVDNLPCEVPRDASLSFGDQLIKNVMPSLINGGDQLIDKASITTLKGQLNSHFDYLQAFISE
jgi:saccharopine dehydrogenase (NAD+, L-lysine-forming)